METEQRPIPRALVVLAEGAEEMEVAIVVDVLRRGGVEVVLAGLDGRDAVRCSRELRLVPDVALADVPTGGIAALVLPGGADGSRRLAESAELGRRLRAQVERGGIVAAICAAPIALVAHGVAAGRELTSHPGVREQVAPHGRYVERAVVWDEPFLTSRGPGTAFEFALALVERMRGAAVAGALRGPMMLSDARG